MLEKYGFSELGISAPGTGYEMGTFARKPMLAKSAIDIPARQGKSHIVVQAIGFLICGNITHCFPLPARH